MVFQEGQTAREELLPQLWVVPVSWMYVKRPSREGGQGWAAWDSKPRNSSYKNDNCRMFNRFGNKGKKKKKKSNLSSPSRDIPPILVARRDCSRWMYSMKSRTDHIILYILFHSWHWHSRLMENNRNNG